MTELDGRRIARLRVTASVPSQPGQAQPSAPALPASSSTVAAGRVRLDSEAPHE